MTNFETGASDRATLAGVRRLLLLTVVAGIVGMRLELLFIGHVEDWLQLVPIVLFPAGLIAMASHVWRQTRVTARAVRRLMVLFLISGALGMGLHYRGNQEFELEMNQSAAGLALVRDTLTGATPVLAPGSMALLGLVGLAAVHRFSGPDISPAISQEDAS